MSNVDYTSEAEVIYFMVTEGKLLPLEVDDFSHPDYQEIFRVIKQLSENKVPITTKSVIESLSGKPCLKSLTTILMNTLNIKNLDIRIKSIKENRGKRELVKTQDFITSLLGNPTVTAGYIAEQAIERYKKIAKLHGGTRNWTQDVRDLLAVTSGNITVTYCYNQLHSVTSGEKNKVRQILCRLEQEGLIEKTGRQAGEYRIKDQDLEEIDWKKIDVNEFKFSWPLGIGLHYRLMPKNIVTIAGETNAGKTALGLNVAALNAEMYPGRIHYFSSEMGNIELRSRLEEFAALEPPANVPLELWDKVRFYERVGNFNDVVVPDAINIVDYLELHEDFYKVGKYIKEIYDRLTTGVAIILIQKKQGAQYGYGAELTVQKARLAINLENDFPYHRAMFSKVKNWRNPKANPNGLEIKYSLLRGAEFRAKGGWYRPTAEEIEQRKGKGKKQWQTK